jgi:hydrogenase/urease accessory protein HupE
MNRLPQLLILVAVAAFLQMAQAHESRPAYLEINETIPGRYDVLWRTPLNAGMPLPIVLKFPNGVDNVREPATRELPDSLVERRIIRVSDSLTGKRIDFVGLQATITDVLVRVRLLDGSEATTVVRPSKAWVEITGSRGLLAVASSYALLGIEHILFGLDHLLFILALMILVKGWRRLVGTITAFTVAHSITLAAATLGFVHVSAKPVEATIALSIVFVACEIVHGRRGRSGLAEGWPWVIAFSFGLLHGLGFAGALREVGLPQNAIPLALLFFNIGVELGQLLFIGVVMAVIAVGVRAARKFSQSDVTPQSAFAWCENISAYAIGGVAAFWLIERTLSFVA